MVLYVVEFENEDEFFEKLEVFHFLLYCTMTSYLWFQFIDEFDVLIFFGGKGKFDKISLYFLVEIKNKFK
jgi:hypothetical protein